MSFYHSSPRRIFLLLTNVSVRLCSDPDPRIALKLRAAPCERNLTEGEFTASPDMETRMLVCSSIELTKDILAALSFT